MPEPERDDKRSESRRGGRPRRWVRVGLWALGSLAGVLVLLVGGALLLLANLDHRWVKGPVERALSEVVGAEVRYDRLSVSPFSGVEAEGVVIATPALLRAYADEMIRVDALRVPIEFRALLDGDVVIPSVDGGAVEVSVVVIEDGRDSFGELVGGDGDADAEDEADDDEVVGLSRSLDALRQVSLSIGKVRLGPVRGRLVEVAASVAQVGAQGGRTPTPAEVVRRSSLDSLGVFSDGLVLGEAPTGSVLVRADGGGEVVLRVVGGGDEVVREARVVPWVSVSVDSDGGVAAVVNAELVEQSIFAELQAVRALVKLDARGRFEPEAGRTTVEVEELALLDSMVTATGGGVFWDPLSDEDREEDLENTGAVFSSGVVEGRGTIDVAALPWSLAWLRVEAAKGAFAIDEVELSPEGVTKGRASLEGEIGKVAYAEDGVSVEVDDADVKAVVSAPEDPTQTLGTLRLEVAAKGIGASERREYRWSIEGLEAVAELDGFGLDDDGMWGAQGVGSFEGSMQRSAAKLDGVSAKSKFGARLDVDLGRHRIAGSVPIDWLSMKQRGVEPVRLRNARVAVVAEEPTHWTGHEGTPSIVVDGAAGRVAMGERHFRAPALTLGVKRTERGRYDVTAGVTADRVSWGTFRREPASRFAVHAVADTRKPALDADASLSIAGGAATGVSLRAGYDAPTLRYELTAAGAEAGPVLGAWVFADGGHRTDECRFTLESRGAFRGVVWKDDAGELVVAEEPLRTARGTHRSELQIERAVLLRAELTHEVSDFVLTAESTHEAPGSGSLDVKATFVEGRYGAAERPMTLRDFEERAQVAYAALHGVPSFSITTTGTLRELKQPYFRQYPVANVTFGAEMDVDDTSAFAVRRVYWKNPAGGTSFEAQATYEGWEDVRSTEVCIPGLVGCPQVVSIYGRQAANVTGTFEQDFGFWRSTERAKSRGSLVVPFAVESGDLNTYRVKATAEFRDVVIELPHYGLLVEGLDARIPVDQEIATEPSFFVVPGTASNAMAKKRFFDLYPFTKRDSFFKVDRVELGGETLGPIAANMHISGPTIAMDQIHAAYRGGFVTGQALVDLDEKDPEVAFRGHLTGVRVEDGKGPLDANMAMSFDPTTLIMEGKAQVVRMSKDHLYAVIDGIDPYREDEGLNRVRLGLKFGYPKFVLVTMDEGLMNAKIDLGGLAGAVRIDEIQGIPVTPFLEQYLQPYIEMILSPSLPYDDVQTDKVTQRNEAPLSQR